MPVNAGDRVGSYEVIAKIGEGVAFAEDPKRLRRST